MSPREYHGPPDPRVSPNRIEQIIAECAVPNVDVQYKILEYRVGDVAVLEVKRDAAKLPYSVAKALGLNKRIVVGQLFVRHGSQVEEPVFQRMLLCSCDTICKVPE